MNKNWKVNRYDMMIQMFWESIPCLLVVSYWCFRGAGCLHLQGPWISRSWIRGPWRWRQQAIL